MKTPARAFEAGVTSALADTKLRAALAKLPTGLVANRRAAVERLPEFEALREAGRRIRDHTLANLDLYLAAFESRATAAGTHVHWAHDAAEARSLVGEICRKAGARLIAKGKSMISEEIGLNGYLESEGMAVVETDLGEYIVQRRGETPSHIIAPAIHVTEAEVAADFRRWHEALAADRPLSSPESLVAEARSVLRETFLSADVGITGANFLVAETGSTILVTNEGNGDLCQTIPRILIVLASIEKVVPTLEDTATLLRLLSRSATGQDITAYTTFATGPRRPGDLDGPQACHVILLDNGRAAMLDTKMRAALRCIRCGACMNHCPVYNAIGGHAYASVYPGPIGAVLTPALLGIGDSHPLPSASTFCGACESVCPVKIPLVSLMRHWRERHHATGGGTRAGRMLLWLWAVTARRPQLYRHLARWGVRALSLLGANRHVLSRLPFLEPWTRYRDLPSPQGKTFLDQWTRQREGNPP